ncbi:MAG TPA: hypothetical protein VFQ45_23085 [Longimicrobium sp.]|nr:hypothetical protein [Longimicrobium sp.]
MPRTSLVLPLLLLAACPAPARRVPVPPPPPAPVVEPAAPPAPPPPTLVWTRDAGQSLLAEGGAVPLPYVGMRLEVLRSDTTDLLVRCVHCRGNPTGWIAPAAVVHQPRRPLEAAQMELGDFVLAIRDAAARRDVAALRQVMSRDFVHRLGPVETGVLEALGEWEREQYRDLDRLPFVLDRGVAAVPGTPVWAAPPEFAALPNYADLRAGFRRGARGWEWIFLVRNYI